MYVPIPTTTLRDFTFEHVRCIVPAHRAQTTALALVSGMLPPVAASTRDDDMLNMALRWFGTHLYPLPTSDIDLPSSRVERMHSARRCIERLADIDTVCVLDLVAATHTTAITQDEARRVTAMCGSATLSVTDNDTAIRMALRNMEYGHDHGQLRVPFTATASSTPRDTLDELRHAVELSGTTNPDHNVPTLRMLSAGRPGDRSDHNYTSCMRFAQYAPDDHDVWTIRRGQRTGDDLVYDALVSSLSGTAYYRVFESWPTDPFERV